jgi:predicted metal-dependent peptidase
MSNQDTLSRATKELMLKEPFYGLFLIMMNKVWRNDLDTAGVSKHNINVQLAINPTFWENLSSEYRVGILKHEILHVAFQHLILRDSYKNPKLFNIAADLEINQYIDRAYMPGGNYPSKEKYEEDTKIFVDNIKDQMEKGTLTPEAGRQELLKIPMRSLFLEDFQDVDGNALDPKGGTDYYYKKLEETMDQNGESSCPSLNQALGNGAGGSAGNGHPGDAPWNHKTWEEFEGMSESEKKVIQKQIDYQLKEVAEQVQKGRGHIPGEFQQMIDELFKEDPPKFNWKAYLRNFVGGSTQTLAKKTRRKKSKRFPKNPGLKIIEERRVLVGIDTSGSVSATELAEFFHEMHHMHKTGTEITVVQCDTQISSIKKYRTPEDGKLEITGRGGTYFDPVVDYYNENIKDYSCLIYFTDGEAPNPERPPNGRTLWVLSEQSSMNEDLPGTVIRLET